MTYQFPSGIVARKIKERSYRADVRQIEELRKLTDALMGVVLWFGILALGCGFWYEVATLAARIWNLL